MPKLNKILAVLVLFAAGIWVLTGNFSSVGSEIGHSKASDVAEPAADGASESAEAAPTEGAEAEDSAPLIRKVRVAEVTLAPYQRMIRISGNTVANKRVVLAARSSGMVLSVDADAGELVTEGAILLRQDVEGRDLALTSAEQQLVQRQADAEAYKKLLATGDMPELQVNAALTALRAAESQVEMARIELDRTNVTAPFSGILDSVDAEVGTWLAQGTPVATLLQLDPLVAAVQVNENTLGSIRVGDKASVLLATGEVVEGTIRFVSRDAAPQTRTYKVEVEIANADNRIPSGMSAEIQMSAVGELAATLPRSVVLLDDEGVLGVRTVGPDNKVEFHEVTILDDTPQGLVLRGVPDGARIIVLGQNFVQDGDVVEAAVVEIADAAGDAQ